MADPKRLAAFDISTDFWDEHQKVAFKGKKITAFN